MFANTERRRRDDELMAAAHDEYMDWLTGLDFADPDDPTDADTTVMIVPELTPDEIFWITEEELYRQERAALRADLFAF